MLLAINRQIALAPGEYHRPARRRLTQKHQSCQRRNCLNYSVVTRSTLSVSLHIVVHQTRCGYLGTPLLRTRLALLVPTTMCSRRLWNGMIECMGGRDQRQSESLCKVPVQCHKRASFHALD
ncbi:hypothetical protein ABIF90_007143 [Bradyrhizobium japonicum]